MSPLLLMIAKHLTVLEVKLDDPIFTVLSEILGGKKPGRFEEDKLEKLRLQS